MKAQLGNQLDKAGMMLDQDQEELKSLTTYSWESFSKIANELIHLIIEEWDEASPYKEDTSLSPDWGSYFRMENTGVLKIITARQEDKLIGFITFILIGNLHCRLKMAISDSYFVMPAYRGDRVGIHLFKEAEKKFKEEGINKMLCHDPFGKIGGLFQGLDFRLLEMVWEKTLNGQYS